MHDRHSSDELGPGTVRAIMAGVDLAAIDAELAALAERPAWQLDAACRYEDPHLFFPGRGEPSEPAKAICARCPVRDDCSDFASSSYEVLHGIWAGTSGRQRRRGSAAVVGRREPEHGTVTRYSRGCRCEPCRGAKARYKADWKVSRRSA